MCQPNICLRQVACSPRVPGRRVDYDFVADFGRSLLFIFGARITKRLLRYPANLFHMLLTMHSPQIECIIPSCHAYHLYYRYRRDHMSPCITLVSYHITSCACGDVSPHTTHDTFRRIGLLLIVRNKLKIVFTSSLLSSNMAAVIVPYAATTSQPALQDVACKLVLM